ncbi:unnamed protein product [Camellia sinensis]
MLEKKNKKKKKNGSNSNNGDRKNHRTTPLSTVVSDCMKRWFQKARGSDFSGEFVEGIADAIDMGYGDVVQVDSADSVEKAAQEVKTRAELVTIASVKDLRRGVKLINNLFPKYLVAMKQKHAWSVHIKDLLVEIAAKKDYRYISNGSRPKRDFLNLQNQDPDSFYKSLSDSVSDLNKQSDSIQETPILIAAKNGISELLESMLKHMPVAIHDMNSDGKNLILLAVENRQPHVFKMLQDNKNFTKALLNCVDNKRNNALHHAAMLPTHRTWDAPDAVLQMQWELKWYE